MWIIPVLLYHTAMAPNAFLVKNKQIYMYNMTYVYMVYL